jgi:glycosyltransferase involved in cell wall biosynthesis
MMRKLDVLISTIYEAGICRVADMNLPRVDGVHYIVSWQMPNANSDCDVPIQLLRDDVTVSRIANRGTSINRNNAIAISMAEYCLVADDDIVYTPEQLKCVIETLDSHPEVDVATFKYSGEGNYKTYPETECDIKRLPKNYSVSAIEIAFRRKSLQGKLLFNEKFGPGNHPLQACEDSVFLLEARKAGFNCRFFPIVITYHAGISTGGRIYTKGIAMAEGAYIRKEFGIKGVIRVPLFVYRRVLTHQLTFLKGFLWVMKGFLFRL